jgi:oxaloacetate decarboxylase alpha subunit
MAREVKFWETVLRDGQQSLWATRMTTGMMRPVARTMGEAGYWNIGTMGGAAFESCVYYHAEDPFERMRMMATEAPAPFRSAYVRSLGIFGWDTFNDEVFDFTCRVLSGCGITLINTFDALNDTRNMETSIRATKRAGLHAVGSLIYVDSPVHTDEVYVRQVRELAAMGADGVQIKDSSSLMTTDRFRTLVPKLIAACHAGGAMFHFHTHCATGLGPMHALEAIDMGTDVIHTAISPLANGGSQPATEQIGREAATRGYRVGLDFEKLDRIAAHFTEVARRHGKPLGQPAAYDTDLMRHQMPGGMLTNLKAHLREVGQADRLDEVLEEIARMREELGYPAIASPLSQYIAVQALLNLVDGERYRTVQTEIRKLALGWYGRTPGPVDPNLIDRIGNGEEPISERPGALLPPVLDRLRGDLGAGATDEDLFLALHFKRKLLDKWEEARKVRPGRSLQGTPVATLVRELAERPQIAYAFVRKGTTSVTHVA